MTRSGFAGPPFACASRARLLRRTNRALVARISAAMNMWLQKQVMTQLAQNGGKVPDDLKT
jgi:hypothetical protein